MTLCQLLKRYRLFLRAYFVFLQSQAVPVLGPLYPQHENITLFQKARNCSSTYIALHFRRNISLIHTLRTFLVFRKKLSSWKKLNVVDVTATSISIIWQFLTQWAILKQIATYNVQKGFLYKKVDLTHIFYLNTYILTKI